MPCLCRECTHTFKREALFCSAACAATGFKAHRDSAHLPPPPAKDGGKDGSGEPAKMGSGKPPQLLLPTPPPPAVKDGQPRPRYSDRGKDVRDRVVPLSDALRLYQAKNAMEGVILE